MSIFGELERLITEHGSAMILRERLLLAKDQYEALEKEVSELHSENKALESQIKQSEDQIAKLSKLVGSSNNQPGDFDETTTKILKIFFDQSDDVSLIKSLGTCILTEA